MIVSTVDSVLCHRDGEGIRTFPSVKSRLLSFEQEIVFINNGGNYAYRLWCEELELNGEMPRTDPRILPASAADVRQELENIISGIMGKEYPLLVSYAWAETYRDGGIKAGGIIPPDERDNPAWSLDWRLPDTGMLRQVCTMFEVAPESIIFVTASPDGIRAARSAGMEWLHPLEL